MAYLYLDIIGTRSRFRAAVPDCVLRFFKSLSSNDLQAEIAPPIRFEVELDESTSKKNWWTGPTVMAYTKVLSKTGEFVNLGTGAFTAPRKGTYRFFFSAITGEGKVSYCRIWSRVNEIAIYALHVQFTHSLTENSYVNFIFTHDLEKGDKVDVFVSEGTLYVSSYWGGKPRFGGELLY